MADPNDKPQADKFRDLARELEADEDEAAFDGKLKPVVKTSGATDAEPEQYV